MYLSLVSFDVVHVLSLISFDVSVVLSDISPDVSILFLTLRPSDQAAENTRLSNYNEDFIYTQAVRTNITGNVMICF